MSRGHYRGGAFRVAVIADRADIEPLFSSVVDLIDLVYLQDFVARANVKAVSDIDALGSLFEVVSMLKDDDRHGFKPHAGSIRSQLTILGYAKDLIEAQQYLSLDNLSTNWDIRVVVVGDRLAMINYRDRDAAKLFQVLPTTYNVARPCRLFDNQGNEHDVPAGTAVAWKDFNRALLDERIGDDSYGRDGSRFDLYMVKKEGKDLKATSLHDLRHRLVKERRSIDDVVSPDATVFFFGDSLS